MDTTITQEGVSPTFPASAAKEVKVMLAPTLELAQAVPADVTVEAEYGDTAIEGRLYTAAHHGSRSGNPCPCVDTEIPAVEGGVILISHIDLDTVGGVARALGFPNVGANSIFWGLAAFVDVNGPHKLSETVLWELDGPNARAFRELRAYWAWSQANRGERKDPTKVHDVTSEVKRHIGILADIFGEPDDGDLLKAGDAFQEASDDLNLRSFREVRGDVVIRVAATFVNHLYTTHPAHDALVCGAVVAYNTTTKAITLSFADKDDPRNACEIMQKVYGPDAGGHKGIAGSPRGLELDPIHAGVDMREIVAVHL